MFSLQKIFGKERTFFSMFEAAIDAAEQCAASLRAFIVSPSKLDVLERIHLERNRNKQICEEISQLAVNTFVTALEREDIEALATALYKIPKPVEKFAERYKVALQYVPEVKFEAQAETLIRAIGILGEMVRQLSKGNSLEYVRSLNARMQQVETEADMLENNLLHELYEQRQNALRVIIIKDLYELLEKGVDRCRDCANLITHIVFKNS